MGLDKTSHDILDAPIPDDPATRNKAAQVVLAYVDRHQLSHDEAHELLAMIGTPPS